MNDDQTRTHQMTVRVREFNAQRLADFSETGAARQFFNDLIAGIAEAESLAEAQNIGIGQARHGTRTRSESRAALRDDIDAIYRIARILGVEDQFHRPEQNTDEALVNAGKTFAANATPLKAQFIALEMPADFLEELHTHIDELKAAIVAQGNAVGDHVSASSALDDALGRCVEIVRGKLDGIMKNKYANNPGALAEWTSASHIERAPKRTKAAGGGGSTQTPPPTKPA